MIEKLLRLLISILIALWVYVAALDSGDHQDTSERATFPAFDYNETPQN